MIKVQVWGGHGRAVQHALTCFICMCENTLLYKGLLLVSHICGEKKVWNLEHVPRKNSWLLLPQGSARLAPCHALDPLQREANTPGGGGGGWEGWRKQHKRRPLAWVQDHDLAGAACQAEQPGVLLEAPALPRWVFWKRQVWARMGASSTFYDRSSLRGEAVIFSQGVLNQFRWSSVCCSRGAKGCHERGWDKPACGCSWAVHEQGTYRHRAGSLDWLPWPSAETPAFLRGPSPGGVAGLSATHQALFQVLAKHVFL